MDKRDGRVPPVTMDRMAASPSPRPHPFWSDTRFLLGVALVIASVAGVWLVVSTARETSSFLVATRTVVVGASITAEDVRPVEIALGAAGEGYLGADALSEGAVAARTIASGELVPHGAVEPAGRSEVTTVVVQSHADLPVAIASGARAELWFAPPNAEDAFDPPRILVADATVGAVQRDEALMGGAAVALELVVPRSAVPDVLAAQADGSILSVIPVG